uniref:Uncharacterized protein n=1 Tax=Spongospora subterranea TaxID=70186 RepID=A0A0H5R357_9EUKA|eukprot:CRZ08320.1 hypothetical protein [Spongospora subterranea]
MFLKSLLQQINHVVPVQLIFTARALEGLFQRLVGMLMQLRKHITANHASDIFNIGLALSTFSGASIHRWLTGFVNSYRFILTISPITKKECTEVIFLFCLILVIVIFLW